MNATPPIRGRRTPKRLFDVLISIFAFRNPFNVQRSYPVALRPESWIVFG